MLDPSALQRYSLIRVYFEYKDEKPGLKRFVVLWHQEIEGQLVVVCAKATTKVDRYLNDLELFNGCVYYPAKEIELFEENTVIQPENALALPYDYLIQQDKKGRFEVLGDMPEDFEEQFLQAVEASITLTPVRKETIRSKLKKY